MVTESWGVPAVFYRIPNLRDTGAVWFLWTSYRILSVFRVNIKFPNMVFILDAQHR